MPRVPVPGTFPTTDQVRPVPLVEFDAWSVAANNPFRVAWGAGVEISSHPIDVLQSLYQGVPDVAVGGLSAVKGLGWAGTGNEPEVVIFTQAVYLDVLLSARHPVSLQFEWIYDWRLATRRRLSYRWLPVQGNDSADNREIPHMLQGLRVPAPWFQYRVRNEHASEAIATGDVLFHLFLRSQ